MQYGAFLAAVAVMELGAGASVYAYRNSLNEKFDQSIKENMALYEQDEAKTARIDYMQTTVSDCTILCNEKIKY